MKALIYMPFAQWSPHLETDLEIAMKHVSQGDDVHIIQCSGELPSCEPNIKHSRWICFHCQSRRDAGLDLVGIPNEKRYDLNIRSFQRSISLPDFETKQELKAFTVDGIDFGMAVLSSLISRLREPNPDVKKYRIMIHSELRASMAIFDSISHRIKELKPDVFYLFNGRLNALRAALRAAQKLGVKTFVHERAFVTDKYSLAEDTSIHDLNFVKRSIESTWATSGYDQNRNQIASSFFEDRRRGKEQAWHSYVPSQIKKLLPPDFNPQKRNIAIFNTSDDEFEGVVGHENPLYENQFATIKAISEFDLDENIHFYLRVHPNLKGLQNSQTLQLQGFKAKNFTVIEASSPVDTYFLMDSCEKVITFGSTAGIEAVYWNKPSILVGKTFYEGVEGCYRPSSREEFRTLINSRITPKGRETALPYGYWCQTFGLNYKFYEIESLFSGKFLGKPIRASFASRLGLKLNKPLDRVLKF